MLEGVSLAVEVGGYHPVQGICNKKKLFLKIQKLKLVLKFLVFFLVSTNNILTFVEDFKSIPVPSKEISSLEVEQIFEILTLLSPNVVPNQDLPQATPKTVKMSENERILMV